MPGIIKIDIDLCTECGSCVDACFVDVIRWNEEKSKPFAAYPEDCQTCYVCEKVCPADAVEVIPDYGSKYYPRVLSTERR